MAQGLQPLATDIVLIYLMFHAWVTGFVQWGVAGSPSLLGCMCDFPPQRCALIPSQAAQLHGKVLVASPALCHLVLLVVPAGEGFGGSQWELWAQLRGEGPLAEAGLVCDPLKGFGAMSSPCGVRPRGQCPLKPPLLLGTKHFP